MRGMMCALLVSSALAASAASAAGINVAPIIDEGMNRSQVLLTGSELMDRIGPRLTNSKNLDRAEDWALAKFRSYSLAGVAQ